MINQADKKILINFSNHPCARWCTEQIRQAESYGKIVDILFPAVDPQADEAEICRIGREYVQQIMSYCPAAVLCQGEFTLAYFVIGQLKKNHIPVLAACSERKVTEEGNVRKSIFEFVRFREYQ